MRKFTRPSRPAFCNPFPLTTLFPKIKITAPDSRYTAVIQALDDLVDAVGLKAA
jgi:hypothetical protein